MIGKTIKGNGFSGVLRYVFEKPEAHYIGGNMASRNPDALAREFRTIANFNHRVKRPVAHISLSPSPNEQLSDSRALSLAQRYMEKIGFQECQWVLVKHNDTQTADGQARPHFHIIANRVRQTDHKVVSAWRDWRRSEVAIRDLEQEFGLIEVQPSWEFERKAPTTGQSRRVNREQTQGQEIQPVVKIQLQNVIDELASDHPTMPELVKELKEQGVEVKVSYYSTGKVQGITYGMDGITFSGTQLGKAYTFPGLQKYRGIDYQPERDDKLLCEPKPQAVEPKTPEPTQNILMHGLPRKSPRQKQKSNQLEL